MSTPPALTGLSLLDADAMGAWRSPLYLDPSVPSRGIKAKYAGAHQVFPRLLAAGQHPPVAINSLAEAILKRIVLLAFLDMTSDSHADDLRDWLTIDSRHHVQFLCLVCRQANCHCLDSLHSRIVGYGVVVVNLVGIVVSCYIDSTNTKLEGETTMVAENQLDRDDLGKPEDGTEGFDKPNDDKTYTIQIDRTQYVLKENRLTGADLRRVPTPPIPPDRDIFQIIPGRPDEKIEDDARILITDGLRFFTAPNTINPGVGLIG